MLTIMNTVMFLELNSALNDFGLFKNIYFLTFKLVRLQSYLLFSEKRFMKWFSCQQI